MDRGRRVALRSVVAGATMSLFAAHATSGCSMALVKGPPTGPQPDPPPPLECTTNVTWPILDAVGGALVTFETGALVAVGEAKGSLQVPLVVVGLSAMVLLFYSSTTGFSATRACREAKKREAWMPRPPPRVVRMRIVQPVAPPPEPVPPPPPPLVRQKADPE